MDWKRYGRIGLLTAEWIGVVVFALLFLAFATLWGMLAWVGDEPAPMGHNGQAASASPAEQPTEQQDAQGPAPTAEEAASLFAPVHRVLTSPRCMNCHPSGDRPLARVGDVHAMNISRASADAGLECSTCHADHNSPVPNGPPGAPRWSLPPAQTPMIFQGHSVTSLCKQLRDPGQNGEHDLAALLHHVGHDPLVAWAWEPGGDRAKPPMTHAEFVTAFSAWVEAGGICPGETEPPVLAPEAGTQPPPEAVG